MRILQLLHSKGYFHQNVPDFVGKTLTTRLRNTRVQKGMRGRMEAEGSRHHGGTRSCEAKLFPENVTSAWPGKPSAPQSDRSVQLSSLLSRVPCALKPFLTPPSITAAFSLTLSRHSLPSTKLLHF